MDFTLKTYRQLLEELIAQNYTFQTYADFLERPQTRAIILRHDVEARYPNAMEFARIQQELNIRGTYYFRFLPDHFDTVIIRDISAMGHEIGYHYDDLSYCKGNYVNAIRRFEKNLATLREIADVKTICMEGAPLSKWDNRELWGRGDKEIRRQGDEETRRWGDKEMRGSGEAGKQGSGEKEKHGGMEAWGHGDPSAHTSRFTSHYNDYGIIGEPYFDTDYSKVFYLTDTGRRWDGYKVSIRDKVGQLDNNNLQFKIQNLKLHRTGDIISAAKAGRLPDQIMFTFHPQRWTDKPLPWIRELVMQNVKNVAKRVVLSLRS